MPHVKGIRRDGFINVDDNIDFRGTVRGAGDGIMRPYGALDFYVDGTDGRDERSGKSWNGAFKTVQKAITTQIAQTNAKGDIIWIAPGSYNEAIVAPTLTKVQLIGATCGGESSAVKIYSTSGHALCVGTDVTYTTTMANSAIRNITFLTPSGTNVELAAVRIDTMQMSIINNCKFLGTFVAPTGQDITVGLQIGCLHGGKYSFHEYGTISNCEFGTNGPRTQQVDVGIRVGARNVETPASTGFKAMKIIDNIICAEHSGIKLGTGASSCGGTLIARNTIQSHTGGTGPYLGIWTVAQNPDDELCMIHDNRICAKNDAIGNFKACNVQGNIVSIDSGDPQGELPLMLGSS